MFVHTQKLERECAFFLLRITLYAYTTHGFFWIYWRWFENTEGERETIFKSKMVHKLYISWVSSMAIWTTLMVVVAKGIFLSDVALIAAGSIGKTICVCTQFMFSVGMQCAHFSSSKKAQGLLHTSYIRQNATVFFPVHIFLYYCCCGLFSIVCYFLWLSFKGQFGMFGQSPACK